MKVHTSIYCCILCLAFMGGAYGVRAQAPEAPRAVSAAELQQMQAAKAAYIKAHPEQAQAPTTKAVAPTATTVGTSTAPSLPAGFPKATGNREADAKAYAQAKEAYIQANPALYKADPETGAESKVMVPPTKQVAPVGGSVIMHHTQEPAYSPQRLKVTKADYEACDAEKRAFIKSHPLLYDLSDLGL
jgi:hypothetical protein